MNFNEPVEQLLLLASMQLQSKNIGTVIPANFNELLNSVKKAGIFPLRDYLNTEVAVNLYPFDILSASVLTLALQEYAQNERSLFSFIENDDLHGINNFNKKGTEYYNLSKVYDYLTFNFFSYLSTKHNPHYQQWASMRGALERAEIQFTEPDDYFSAIKTIGLLNIFSNKGSPLNDEFLLKYLKHGLSTNNPGKS
ncbi:MAG: hypothetical protein U5Q03_01560 [Bacteroidota bacterium]|nr:hypothetical protein [Bacteroidota bacterium]